MIGPAVWPPILARHTHTQTDRQHLYYIDIDYVCMCVRKCIRAYVRTCMRAYVRGACAYACVFVSERRVRMCVYVRASARACACGRARVGLRVRVRGCGRAHGRGYLRALG